ncbi:MAG: Asp/Glu racemase [Gemmatimonas sp.]|nr:Asp/Glu racemase [Gemmatimonas sp.]
MTLSGRTAEGASAGHTLPRRVGLIVPSSNVTIETEVPAILRYGRGDGALSFHAARARMRQVTRGELSAMNAESMRATVEVADAQPDVVVSACLVALMAQGPGYHREAEREIYETLRGVGCIAPVLSSAGALIEGLHSLGASRIGLVTPYTRKLTELVANYLEHEGFTVCDTVSLDVPNNQQVARLDPADLCTHWRRLDLAGADALVISACVQMPSLPIIQAVEDASGLPTVSAATATVWALLRALSLSIPIPEAGQLLDPSRTHAR